jgi:hypothetical protein
MKTDIIKLENGQTLLVEVLDIELPKDIKDRLRKESGLSDLPEGAKPVGVIDDMKMSIDLLKDDLKNITNSVKDAFKENRPDEFSVEVNFGFAGEGAIPFIVSAKSNASIKVKATWKKGS